eukprot:TRINITY_DN36119_c0_g2_i1.p1 TRINITY_DN36119_c0_g2~~TRINITY_DN36119_c0_g2_i1.p1  ORF type:complete len:607 (-),score=181.23 TRINITY_DN36119_c0_g2_i1:153-1973(-)
MFAERPLFSESSGGYARRTAASAPATAADIIAGEVRHEREVLPEVAAAAAVPKRRAGFNEALQQRLEEKRALQKELGYPEYDPRFDDPDWLREQLRKENEDPRENANFFLDPSHPEFVDNLARRPYAKAILKTEEHRKHRKNVWLEQFRHIENMNNSRKTVAELLQDCAPETKRTLAPIMKYKIMDVFLANVELRARELGMAFEELLNEEDTQSAMKFLTSRLMAEGQKAADELMSEFDIRMVQVSDEFSAEEKKLAPPATSLDAKALTDALNQGAKFKADGLAEWEREDVKEALESWRRGCHAIDVLNVAVDYEKQQTALGQLHAALLRNRAQAAIKLGFFTEALEASEKALELDDQDHKAWFRKACALEGLGRLELVEDCLQHIDEISVGRADQARLRKDTDAKRTRIAALQERSSAEQQRMLRRGFQQSLFSEDRAQRSVDNVKPAGPPALGSKVGPAAPLNNATRMRLTKDGARDLLRDLKDAYEDKSFKAQIRKLAHDVQHDTTEFLCHLGKVALPIQTPVLRRWGFDTTSRGVQEMTRAIQDHTRGSNADVKLRAEAEEVVRILYGPMYSATRGSTVPARDQAQAPPQEDGEASDSSGGG